mmetsp:Transcript_85533/g.204996  ORF Transcript_85533/g.204996 Transcript_85533/m.204996 type:complete len:104 (-) Transcript_85533:578-889(-)
MEEAVVVLVWLEDELEIVDEVNVLDVVVSVAVKVVVLTKEEVVVVVQWLVVIRKVSEKISVALVPPVTSKFSLELSQTAAWPNLADGPVPLVSTVDQEFLDTV